MTDPDDEQRRARAAARRSWPGRVTSLSDAPEAFAPDETTAGERIAMVWQLTLEAWALAGKPIPDYPRHLMPGRLRRLGEPAD